jgi:hypothetical protein
MLQGCNPAWKRALCSTSGVALLLLGSILTGMADVVYKTSDGKYEYNLTSNFGQVENDGQVHCNDGGGNALQTQCFRNEPILETAMSTATLYDLLKAVNQDPNNGHRLCNLHKWVCKAVGEYQDNNHDQCGNLYTNCQKALRHLHAMMFDQSPAMTEPQRCNNFARKSIRGFFPDYMSNGIDGSILSESHIAINFGLCRWGQYINVLSDHTGCDPGSIIAMAGQLAYAACGVQIWDLDQFQAPVVHIGRPNPCAHNLDPQMFDTATGQRWDDFSDTQASANASAMESFWYVRYTIMEPYRDIDFWSQR